MTGRIRRARTWHILAAVAPRTPTSPPVGVTLCNPNTTYRFDAVAKDGESGASCKACLRSAWAADPPFALVA